MLVCGCSPVLCVDTTASSFLFSLMNPYNISPIKLANTEARCSVYHNKDRLPVFGSGGDLHISNDCNANTLSFNNFKSYENTTEHQYLLTGSRNFQTEEVEVFAKL
eukprot:TRINITY_DN2633_c0_g1_i7.p1 TRINITY_DN2633_c0_g1~~TRINITY_DN2633_c0_g1_i7.p1  ORF type:complete len:106 (-),score=14.67 TRINITY_DN2633_c0_g1_i7:78-395(-)